MSRSSARVRLIQSQPRDDGYADAQEVADFAADLPERFLHCREMNHSWRMFDVKGHRDGGFDRTLRCSRCKSRKTQHLSSSGMLVGGSRFEYAPGYLAEGLGRIAGDGRGALRLESIRRLTEKGN